MHRKWTLRVAAIVAIAGAWTGGAAAETVAREGYALEAQVRGDGPVTVVFESGFGQGADAWDDVIAELGDACRCIAYARAGIGESTGGTTPATIDAHVRDLGAVVDALAGDTPIVLVGHSYGGLLVTEFMQRRPERLRGVVLVDPSTRGQRIALRQADETRVAADDRMLAEMLPPPLAADYAQLIAQLDLPTSMTPTALPDVPVVLLTATRIADEPFVLEETVAGKAVWKREHATLFAVVTRGRHLYLDTGHDIPHEDPKAVADAIRTVASP